MLTKVAMDIEMLMVVMMWCADGDEGATAVV